ncbi:16521_t:CDS:1, partial [Acaulospora morrowiae]
MSSKIFINSVKIIGEKNNTIDLYGQVIVQHSDNYKEKIVTIEYTRNSWNTGNSVIASQLSTLSDNQELYYFEISTLKVPNTPLHFGFLARFDVE